MQIFRMILEFVRSIFIMIIECGILFYLESILIKVPLDEYHYVALFLANFLLVFVIYRNVLQSRDGTFSNKQNLYLLEQAG